ncbi:sc3 hydrophobin [Stygiomarasmius scandens]|uniref:Hydrophobin n=1 Tax=Marasmiellus scandens TaxID=2682957 RepID=A0ABR1JH10_9AGAR
MQFKLLAVSALATLAAATPLETRQGQCNTGEIQCCNSVQSANSSSLAGLLGILGAVLGPITGQVGVTCSPISVIGVGGNSCTAQPVCCENNSFNGIIALGCTPININL